MIWPLQSAANDADLQGRRPCQSLATCLLLEVFVSRQSAGNIAVSGRLMIGPGRDIRAVAGTRSGFRDLSPLFRYRCQSADQRGMCVRQRRTGRIVSVAVTPPPLIVRRALRDVAAAVSASGLMYSDDVPAPAEIGCHVRLCLRRPELLTRTTYLFIHTPAPDGRRRLRSADRDAP